LPQAKKIQADSPVNPEGIDAPVLANTIEILSKCKIAGGANTEMPYKITVRGCKYLRICFVLHFFLTNSRGFPRIIDRFEFFDLWAGPAGLFTGSVISRRRILGSVAVKLRQVRKKFRNSGF
jgi:hypothetical protein